MLWRLLPLWVLLLLPRPAARVLLLLLLRLALRRRRRGPRPRQRLLLLEAGPLLATWDGGGGTAGRASRKAAAAGGPPRLLRVRRRLVVLLRRLRRFLRPAGLLCSGRQEGLLPTAGVGDARRLLLEPLPLLLLLLLLLVCNVAAWLAMPLLRRQRQAGQPGLPWRTLLLRRRHRRASG